MARTKLISILGGIVLTVQAIDRHTNRIMLESYKTSKAKIKLAPKTSKGKKSTYTKQMKAQPQSVKKDFNQRRR